MGDAKETLKLLIDQTGKRVLFAEAGNTFIDFLFTIFTLPVGTIVGFLGANQMAGCLGDLYQSIETLSSTYMKPNQNTKSSVLKPRAPISSAEAPPLLPSNAYSSSTRSFYKCPNGQSECYNKCLEGIYESIESLSSSYLQLSQSFNVSQSRARTYSSSTADSSPIRKTYISPNCESKCFNICRSYVAEDPNSVCPGCYGRMDSKATYVASPELGSSPPSTVVGDEGGYVKGIVTYLVMDDLVVRPMSTISSIALLSQLHVKDLSSLQEKVVEIGVEEAMELLKASLKSKTVLTDVFFNKK